MFYKQSVNNVKVVVLTLDGGLLDLNRLRYNYYKRLCKQYDKTVSREEFSKNLGNMNTMYENSPINEDVELEELNVVLENELFSYAKLKPNIQKDGIEELLQFFVQRNIKIAIVSTHKTKRAIQYLQLTRLYKYVDFVIGGDSDNEPLPDPTILKTICYQLGVVHNEVLIVANFPNMLMAANKLLMNVVYIPDLVPVSKTIEASVYRVAKNPLEIINIFLFAKYDTVEMFSPLLGMSDKMDLHTLKQTYHQLLEEYADDEGLLRLVNQTYQYFLTEINDKETRQKNTESLDTMIEKTEIETMFDEPVALKEEPKLVEQEDAVTKIEEDSKEHKELVEEAVVLQQALTREIPKDQLLNTEKQIEDPLNKTLAMQKDFVTQATSLNMLMDVINNQKDSITENTVDEIKEIESDEQEKSLPYKIMEAIGNFLYVVMFSTILVLIGMIGYVLIGDYLSTKGLFPSTLNIIFGGYVNIITGIYQFIFDGLHNIVTFIPNYNSLLTASSFASKTGMETILYIIFHTVLIYIIKGIIRIVKKRNEDVA